MIRKIGNIQFKDLDVPVYFDGYSNNINSVWTVRNPDSYYEGIVYQNLETFEITYPEGAIIPNQTKEDRQRIPKFIMVNKETLDKNLIQEILEHCNSLYKKYNNETD